MSDSYPNESNLVYESVEPVHKFSLNDSRIEVKTFKRFFESIIHCLAARSVSFGPVRFIIKRINGREPFGSIDSQLADE